jgi:hypothetical protein
MTLEHHLAQIIETIHVIKIGNREPLPIGDCTRSIRQSLQGAALL